jgi:hypothetical protein
MANLSQHPYLRAALPEVLFVPDLSMVLGGLTFSATRRAVLRGDCGPFLRIGRRIAVRREALLDALAAREVDPAAGPPTPRVLRDEPGGPS